MTGPGEKRFGDYEIIRELGRGGFGVVYEAIEEKLNRRVAIKIYHVAFALSEKQRERFEREAKIASQIDHAGILPVYKIGDVDGTPFLVMQFIEGCSLDHVIKRLQTGALDTIRRSTFLSAVEAEYGGSTLSKRVDGAEGEDAESASKDTSHAETAAQIIAQAADALHAAHLKKIYHRDLKPANLILRKDGRLFVSDFGLARDTTLATLTRTGEFHGTPHYLSPEQMLADRTSVDHRTDIYSLGATLYAILTLSPPHEGASTTDLLQHIVFKRPAPVRKRNPAIPNDLALVVHKAMELNPDDRYDTMSEFADDLRRFLAHEAVTARPIGRAGRAVRWIGRHRKKAMVFCLLFVVIVLAGSWLVSDLVEKRETLERATQAEIDHVHVNVGVVTNLLDEKQVVLALQKLAPLRHSYGEHEVVEKTVLKVEQAALVQLEAFVALFDKDLTETQPDSLVEGAHKVRGILDMAPHLLPPDGHETYRPLLERAVKIEKALDLHTSLRTMFDTDPEKVQDGLARAIGFALQQDIDPYLLNAGVGGRQETHREGADRAFTIIVPGQSGEQTEGGLVFGGYAIESDDPPYRDLEGVDVTGSFVLCIRRCPHYGDPRNPFGDQNQPDSVSAFVRKAEVAQLAGAAGLLIVNQPGGENDGKLYASRLSSRNIPAHLIIPVLNIRRDIADAWLANTGKTIKSLHASYLDELKPRSFVVPDIELSFGKRLPADSPLKEMAELLPFLWSEGSVVPDDKSRQLILGLAALMPGDFSDEILRQALLEDNEADRNWVARLLFTNPRPRLKQDLKRSLAKCLAKWPEVPPSAFQIAEAPRHPILSSIDWDLRKKWYRDQDVLKPQKFTIYDDVSALGYLLGALWKVDEAYAMLMAKKVLPRGEWVAVEILRRAPEKDLADLLVAANDALESKLKGLRETSPSSSREGLERPTTQSIAIFRAMVGDSLADLNDPRGADILLPLIEAGPACSVRYDLEHVLESIAKFHPPLLTDSVFDFYLLPEKEGDRIEDAREVARNLLQHPVRFARIEERILDILGDEGDRRILCILDLLNFSMIKAEFCPELKARILELQQHPNEEVRHRALFAHDPKDDGDLVSMLKTALANASLKVRHDARAALINSVDRSKSGASPEVVELLLDQVIHSDDPDTVRAPSSSFTINSSLLRKMRRGWRSLATDLLLEEQNVQQTRALLKQKLKSSDDQSLPRIMDIVATPAGQRELAPSLEAELEPLLQHANPMIRCRALQTRSDLNDETRPVAADLLDRKDDELNDQILKWLCTGSRVRAILLPENESLSSRFTTEDGVLEKRFAELFLEGLGRCTDLADWPESEWRKARDLVVRMPVEFGQKVAYSANAAAWRLVDPDTPVPGAAHLALSLAEIAVRETNSTNSSYLDTLACAWYQLGDPAKAVKFQERALERLAPDDEDRPELLMNMKRFRKALEGPKK